MSYEIIWSPEARTTLKKTIDYLAKEWNNKVLNHFLDQVENAIKKIRLNPFAYPKHKTISHVRWYKINERLVLYYTVSNDSAISLITFWNTYQNPENLKL